MPSQTVHQVALLPMVFAGVSAGLTVEATATSESTVIEFLDPRTVEHAFRLDRRITPATKHPNNPIIDDCHSAQTVLREKDGTFRMWYVSRRRIPGHTGSAREYTLRYAESADGVTWTFPNLGLKEFDGTRDNNVVLKANDIDATGRKITEKQGLVCGNFCILDRASGPAPHTRGRFTALYSRGAELCFAFSEDGLRWTAYPENPVFNPAGSDTNNNFLFDPHIGKYVLFHRPHPRTHAGPPRANRLVARIESPDLLHWDWNTARCVLDTDERDASAMDVKEPRGRRLQFYGMQVTRYRGLFLGLANLLDTATGIMDVRLVHSFDGIDWRREPHDTALISISPGNWDCGMIGFVATGSPLQVGDNLYFYYGAANMTHNYKIMNDEKTLKMRLGLAIVTRGRLVGYHAGDSEGELLTRPFLLNGPRLLLNADARDGMVKAALVNADGTRIPEYSQLDCEPIKKNGLELPLRWKNGADLGKRVGTVVRLRIMARNAVIYGVQTAAGEEQGRSTTSPS